MKRFLKNNTGVALITVVIGVMFCLLLTSTMLRVSLLGLQSRSINNQVSDNYYDAECVIDTIRMNLQNLSAQAWVESQNAVGDSTNYVKRAYVLLTADDVSHCTVGTHLFTDVEGGSPEEQKYTNIITKLKDSAKNGGTVESFSSIEVVGTGTKLTGLIIHDVEVKYENPTTKMVSYVKMDITLSAPLYASADTPPLASYSMFVGTGAALGGSDYNNDAGYNKLGYLEQEGNVYIGYNTYNASTQVAKALDVKCRNTFILSGENSIINGDVTISQYGTFQITGKRVDVRGKIYIGYKCHLVIGDNTILNCQDILIQKQENGSFESIKTYTSSNPQTYTLGEPSNYYATIKSKNSGDSSAHYHYYDASIVYLEAELQANGTPKEENGLYSYTGAGYDAVIANGSVKKQENHNNGKNKNLTGTSHINLSPNDENLKPKANVTINGKTYDQRFAEIIDVETFEEYFSSNIEDDAAQNNKIRSELKSSVSLSNNKYRPNSSADFQATTRNTASDDKPVYWMKNAATGDNMYKCHILIGKNGGNVVNPQSENEGNFVLTNISNLQINMNGSSDKYSGIYLTSGKLTIEKNDGITVGQSLLLYAQRKGGDLQEFLDTLGRQSYAFLDHAKTKEQLYNTIVNNLFKEGIATFYKNETQTGSNGKKADDQNATMELIDFSNYEKH